MAISKMSKEGLPLGAARRQNYDLKFTKANLQITENSVKKVNIGQIVTSFRGNEVVILMVEAKNLNFEYLMRYKIESNPNYF